MNNNVKINRSEKQEFEKRVLQATTLQSINSTKERGNRGEWILCCFLSIFRALIYECQKQRGVVFVLRTSAQLSSFFASFRIS